MKKKFLTVTISLICILCCILCLTACDFGSHKHNYAAQWEHDETYHWHRCSSEKGTCDAPIVNKDEHIDNDGNSVCDTCGYRLPMQQDDTLYYELDVYTDRESYVVIGVKKGPADIMIPSTFNNKPVARIANGAFSNSNVKSVTIGDNVKVISEGAFSRCDTLENVKIGKAVTTIENHAFYHCTGLKSIVIPSSVTDVSSEAFAECNIETAEIPHNAVYAITSSSLKDVTITSGSGELNGFSDCRALTNVTICDGIESISNMAFRNCENLKSITIGRGITNINADTFEDCERLSNITYSGDIKGWLNISGLDNLMRKGVSSKKLVIDKKEITGNFEIPSGVTSISNAAFYGISGLTGITLPAGMTSIGSYAFYDCKNLKAINIPSSVSNISTCAFYGCTSLQNVKLPSGIDKIDAGTFYSCTSLAEIDFPSSVKSIEYDAFGKCSSLESIELPNGLTDIGSRAFNDCTSLKSIKIPNSVVNIGVSSLGTSYPTFSDCPIENATLPMIALERIPRNNLKVVEITNGDSIADGAFKDCINLTSVTIPESVTRIGSYAFKNCTNLTSIVIPRRVTFIGVEAFYDCTKLVSIVIPDSVESVGSDAFGYCPIERATLPIPALSTIQTAKLKEVVLTSGTLIADNAFKDCGSLVSVTLPSSLVTIGNSSFSGCGNLTSISIPRDVTSIEENAFYNCKKLVEVYNLSNLNIVKGSEDNGYVGYYAKVIHTSLDENSILDITEDGYIFYLDEENSAYLLGYNGSATALSLPSSYKGGNYEIADYAFEALTNITSVTMNNGVTSIGEGAFKGCSGLISVSIGSNIDTISSSAFENCGSLASITMGSSVTSIGESAFKNCDSLISITIPRSVTNIESSAFSGCSVLVDIYYTGDIATWCRVSGLDNLMLARRTLYINGKTLEGEVIIPSGVTSIGTYAFYYCKDITSVTIPNTVTAIGAYAFYYCSGITSITIPDSVESIGNAAFSNCPIESATMPTLAIGYLSKDKLKTVVITSGESIKSRAFYNCSSLESITIAGSVTSIGDNAFTGCGNLKKIYYEGNIDNWCVLSGISNLISENRDIYIGGEAWSELEGDLVINEGVTSIESYAFYQCSGITSITLPSTVTSIGSNAFYGCSSLSVVNISEGVGSIGGYAFYKCSDITSVTLPRGVKSIGSYAFAYCSSLSEVNIPDSVKDIGRDAFKDCPIESATMPSMAIEYIVPSTQLSSVEIIGNEKIGNNAFKGCSSLINVTIRSSVTSIGSNAFEGCSSLESIIIGDSVESIGNYAFRSCSNLTSVTIGNSVTSIGYNVFYGCSGLTSIYYTGDIASWCGISGLDGLMSSSRTLYIDGEPLEGELIIPVGVTSIEDSAFRYCSNLTSITIGNSVTSIGVGAFRYCSSLESITIGNSVTSIGESAFYDCSSLTSIYYTGDIASWCGISGLDNLMSSSRTLYIDREPLEGELIIPVGVTSIEDEAFYYCSGLTSVTIPDGVTSIGSSAFYGCSNLTSIKIPDSVTSIGSSAFYGCDKLKYNTYDNATYLGNSNNPYFALIKATNTNITSCEVNSNTKVIAGRAFYGCRSLESITIGDSVTSISGSAFYECKNLTSIYYTGDIASWCGISGLGNLMSSDRTLYIKGEVLEGELIIPDGVTSIGDWAFEYCSGITSVTIPNSVTSIGRYPFSGCSSLTSIYYKGDIASWCGISGLDNIMSSSRTLYIDGKKVEGELIIPDGVTSIGDSAFYYCSGITSVTIPNSVTSIGDSAFYGCSGLTSITIPDSVTSIGSSAFYNCSSLESITIGNSVTSIGSDAFRDCRWLTSIYYTGDIESWNKISGLDNIMSSDRTLYINGEKV